MDARHAFTVTTIRAEDELVIHARGDVDFAVTPQLVEAVRSAVDDSVSSIVIDCEQVTFIDSEALKAFMEMSQRFTSAGKTFLIGRCSRPVTRIINLLGVQCLLGCAS